MLGKGDFKSLMKWRLAIRLEAGLDVKADKTAEATEEVTVEPMDEDEQISEEVRHNSLPHTPRVAMTDQCPAQASIGGKVQNAKAGEEAGQRKEAARLAQAATQHDGTYRSRC